MGSLKGAIDDVLISDQLSVWQYDVATDCMNFLFGPFPVKEASCLDEVFQAVHPSDIETYKSAFQSVLSGKAEHDECVVRLQLKKKEQYGYFRITMNSIKNEGVVSQVTGLMRDVSLQYKQQELEESRKQRLLLAVKGGNVRLWDYDVKSHILKLYGEDFAVTDLSQKDQTALINRIYEDDKKRSLEIFSVLQNGKDFSINLSLALNVSGATGYSRKYIMISGMPMKKDESGKVLFYTGIYKDETDSHLLINELKELNLTKKLILDNSNAGFAYIDKDFHILWENFSTMYKDSSIGSFFSKNAVGRTCFSAIRNLNVPCKDCYVVEAYKSRKMETKELTLAERTIEFTGIPCFDNGVYLGSVLRGVDITANKQHLKR